MSTDEETEFYNHHARCINYAISVLDATVLNASNFKENNIKYQHPIILTEYFPSSILDTQIQRFNLNGTLPTLIDSGEKLSEWLLEAEKINRSTVFRYLLSGVSNKGEVVIRGLQSLSQTICRLEEVSSFVDGLKYFVPTVGCIDSDPVDRDISSRNAFEVKKILHFYAHAHLQYSKNRIIQKSDKENTAILTDVLTDVAYWLLKLFEKRLETSFRIDRQTFYNEVTSIIAPILKDLSDTNDSGYGDQIVKSLYDSVKVGRPLEPLTAPRNCPSFLFYDFGHSSMMVLERKTLISVGFLNSSNLEIYSYSPISKSGSSFIDNSSQSNFLGYLANNAIYIFSINDLSNTTVDIKLSASSSKPPLACIPLESCQVHEHLDDCHDAMFDSEEGLGTMEITSSSGSRLPFIEFNRESSDSSGEWSGWPACIPSSITYHESILLHLMDSHIRASNVNGEDGKANAFYNWLDLVSATIRINWPIYK